MDLEERIEDTQDSSPDEGHDEQAPDILEGGPGVGEPGEEEEFKPKHKSWNETERARLEAEKMGHTAKEEAARLKRELEEYKRTFREVKGDQKPQPQADTPRKRILREANAKIARLNPDAPDYNEQVQDVWAEANEKIAEAKIKEQRGEELKATSGISMAENALKKAGLSLMVDDPVTGDQVDIGIDAFWALATHPNMPKGVSQQEEIQWVLDQIKMYNDAVIKKHLEGQKAKPGNKPLGRGGEISKAEEEDETPSTLKDEWEEVKQSRRIKR
ncbi:MAG: hypothetical protein KKF33_20340 [Alphaproteobacteria bacterium]|nr:hypothetical protein [Alphaproteobacteria bacterium]